uniref:Fungal lipase-type domain-containing protein n=1 Tax=Arcella intermedia TaxID=1963864 RepID=A0A6B2LEG4_9EUKA
MRPGLQMVTAFHNDTTNANGYVGVNPSAGYIIVAFTGTNPLSIKNWIDDIDTIPTSYSACSGCAVHEGFYHTYLSVQDEVRNGFRSILLKYPNLPVQVTGHSLGAVLAELGALDLIQTFRVRVSSMYHFGGPRLGNDAFTRYLLSSIGEVYRVTHWMDPVPHLPPEAFGFVHNPQEVFYNDDQSSYTLCSSTNGEDPSCSDQFVLDADIPDHLNYIGFDFVSNYLSCL